MKKIFLLALLAFAGYKFYHNGFSFSAAKGAFDKHGKPLVVLFVGPGCGEYCDGIRSVLTQRGVSFDEIDLAGPDGAPVENKYGVRTFPTTIIGKQRIVGSDVFAVKSALAEAYGSEMLGRAERMATNGHFDEQGRAKVVLYGTSWCGYCKAQREFFAEKNIPFDDIDVEASPAGQLAYSALQGNGYPLTYVGYRRFSGFKDSEILVAIDELSKVKH